MSYDVRQTEEFRLWLDDLTDRVAQKAIAKRLVRVAGGLLGDAASVGGGVSELRIHVGAGYRAYYTIRERTVLFVLCGGDKSTQQRDIVRAQQLAADV